MSNEFLKNRLHVQSSQLLRRLQFINLTGVVIAFLLILFAFGQSLVAGEHSLTLDKKTKAAIIDSVTTALNKVYVFPDKAKEMEKLVRKQLKKGKYADITGLEEFARVLTKDLRSICHDRHLGVRPLPPPRPGQQQDFSEKEREKQQLARMRKENFGFQKLEILPGNIGYVDMRNFADAKHAGATAIAAMSFLSNTDAIIFDLRQNGGGSPSMIQLITSYFFDEPKHLNSFYVRKTDSTNQFWTQAYVIGPRMSQTPLYVLTSNYTFSGAEEFTYNLKNMKRATIIGETTGGGAHPVEFHHFKELGVGMTLPFGRAVNPITGTNWEGTGVEPDIAISADKALTKAKLLALKTLTDKTEDEQEKSRLEWALKGLEVKMNPVLLDETSLKPFTGAYGPRKIWLDGGNLFYQREDRPKYELIPMGNDMFMLDGLDYFRIQFERDQSGAVTKLVGLYDNGQTDSHERTGG